MKRVATIDILNGYHLQACSQLATEDYSAVSSESPNPMNNTGLTSAATTGCTFFLLITSFLHRVCKKMQLSNHASVE